MLYGFASFTCYVQVTLFP